MERRNFLKKSALLSAGGAFLGSEALASVAMSAGKENLNSSKNSKAMKIVVLTGSPRREGNSAYLADNFIKGAKESGHSVFRFDAAFRKVGACVACNHCGMNGDCVLHDDFEMLRPYLLKADLVAFVTPMYYFGISAQLKTVIDRFYALNGTIKGASKKAVLMLTYANISDSDAQPIRSHYDTLVDYLGWKNVGKIIVPGVWTAGEIKSTDYGTKAYEMGKSL